MAKFKQTVLLAMFGLLAAALPAQNATIGGGGTNRLADAIAANPAGGTITINDSGEYLETQPLMISPRHNNGTRRAFNIQAAPGQNPTIRLSNSGFLFYSGGGDVKLGSNSGGRIIIDARQASLPGSPDTAFWYIGQEDGLTGATAAHVTLENLQIDATGQSVGFVFGAGGNDGTPNTTGAAVTLRRVSMVGPRTGVNMLYGPASYASSFTLEDSQIYDYTNDSGDAYGIHLGVFGILTPNATLNLTRSIIHNRPSTTGDGETNGIVARAGHVVLDHCDIINEAAGTARAITLIGSTTAVISNSILRGDAGTVNFGSGSATGSYNNISATSIPNSGFTHSNAIQEWPVYVAYGNGTGADNFRVLPSAQSATHGPTPPLGSVGVGAVPTPVPTPTPTPTPAPSVQQNGYVSAGLSGTQIVTLRFDATGQGQYGAETVAAGGSIRNVQSVSLSGPTITINPIGNSLLWDVPFTRAGYYDADRDLNYPNDTNILGATALTLPFRQFVGSSGHVTRIEHFKRLPSGTYFLWLNVANGSRLLMNSHASQNWDLEAQWTGATNLTYLPQANILTLNSGTLSGPLRLTALPRGQRETPQDAVALPSAQVSPARTVEFTHTGKSLEMGQALTEFMQQGMYWAPGITSGGEWVNGAIETLIHADPRSWYRQELRRRLLNYLGFLGYDRFGHFGYLFPWDRYPDYGATGLLNTPPGNAPWDMRMLLLNAMWIHSIHQYVLATGDTELLDARRERWVSTNGAQAQPITGNGGTNYDYVLSSGDMRLDGAPATSRHTLGQTFTATAPFTRVTARLGNPSTGGVASGRMRLMTAPGGSVIASGDFTIPTNATQNKFIDFASQPAGSYYLEVSDNDSGVNYYSPGIIWWGKHEGTYTGGDAYVGPVRANVRTMLETMFSYVRDHMGAAQTGLAYYINDPQYNIPNHKSGRHAVGTTCTYWEPAGGGFDALTGLWYNAACTAMQKLELLRGDEAAAANYASMRADADAAYRAKYWHSVTEGSQSFSRFFAVQDWDGVIRDYGFTYYNLEALVRGITTQQQSREIYRWLDRGFHRVSNGGQWRSNLYDIWEIAPPFNTIQNNTWLNVTGTLPWLEVVSNGGSRLEIAARDLAGRARTFPIDNMHERNRRVLGRYISPDRLTGGRTFDDPGGRGRWQFLGPTNNRLDFEGFREIFPFGSVATLQPDFYFGFDYQAHGLGLNPRVPSELDSLQFSNIGYWRSLFDFRAEAQRTPVLTQNDADEVYAAPASGAVVQSFAASAPFSKVGVHVRVTPFSNKFNNKLTLKLQRQDGAGWADVASTWLSNVEDDAWAWISADAFLMPGQYRIHLSGASGAGGQTIGFSYNSEDVLGSGAAALADGAPGSISGDLALRVEMERTLLTVESVYNPDQIPFSLYPANLSTTTPLGGGLTRWTSLLGPGETRELRTTTQSTAADWPLFE